MFRVKHLKIILLACFWGHVSELQKHLQSNIRCGILIQKLAEEDLDIHTETRGLSQLSVLSFSCCCCWLFGNVVFSPFCPRLLLVFRCGLCALQMGMWKTGKVLAATCEGPASVVLDFDYCRVSVCEKIIGFLSPELHIFCKQELGPAAYRRSSWQSNYKLTRKCLEP